RGAPGEVSSVTGSSVEGPKKSSAPSWRARRRRCRVAAVLRPGMLRVAAHQLPADARIVALPKASQIRGDLDGPLVRRQQVDLQRELASTNPRGLDETEEILETRLDPRRPSGLVVDRELPSRRETGAERRVRGELAGGRAGERGEDELTEVELCELREGRHLGAAELETLRRDLVEIGRRFEDALLLEEPQSFLQRGERVAGIHEGQALGARGPGQHLGHLGSGRRASAALVEHESPEPEGARGLDTLVGALDGEALVELEPIGVEIDEPVGLDAARDADDRAAPFALGAIRREGDEPGSSVDDAGLREHRGAAVRQEQLTPVPAPLRDSVAEGGQDAEGEPFVLIRPVCLRLGARPDTLDLAPELLRQAVHGAGGGGVQVERGECLAGPSGAGRFLEALDHVEQVRVAAGAEPSIRGAEADPSLAAQVSLGEERRRQTRALGAAALLALDEQAGQARVEREPQHAPAHLRETAAPQ